MAFVQQLRALTIDYMLRCKSAVPARVDRASSPEELIAMLQAALKEGKPVAARNDPDAPPNDLPGKIDF